MEINHICSLGGLCHTAQFLKRNNVKKCSYPFDWIFSNCEMITHCLNDKFSTFLNKTYYTNISKTQCGHSLYNSVMFNHHNPLMNENDYSYYIRCIDRFNKLLHNNDKKMFIIMFNNMDNLDNLDNLKDMIIGFNNTLLTYTSNYILVVIYNIINSQYTSHNIVYDNNIHFIELHTISKSNGVSFDNENDNIYLDKCIMANYKFNIIT